MKTLSLFAVGVVSLVNLTQFTLSAQTNYGQKLTPAEYCQKYAGIAREEFKLHGIPASITLAQGMLESNFGASYLAVVGNNHFGIKAYRVNYPNVVYQDDDLKHEPFCAFGSVEEGYRFHSTFLLSNDRYKKLFSLPKNDYRQWALGLKECGYATDENYGYKLISFIETYNLSQYDNLEQVIRRHTLYATSDDKKQALKYVVVQEGDNLRDIAKEFGMRESKLRRANDFTRYQSPQVGDIIYLQSKKSKALPGYETYVVKPGDSLWKISQIYGVTVKSLIRRNNLDSGAVSVGQVLRLR